MAGVSFAMAFDKELPECSLRKHKRVGLARTDRTRSHCNRRLDSRRSARRSGRALMVGLLFVFAGAGSAQAAEIVTWETKSRFVDPAEVRFNPSPPGAPPRQPGLRVNVYLPDGYDGKRRFPVLYLLHNLYTTFEGWANSQQGDVMNVARGFPGIIVMPEGARGFYANWWNDGARGNPGWERYHLGELVRLAERRLRIKR